MPLDSHSYLVSQGWGGKGTGLRQGAISRPLAIPQKKTLAGLGKDRDEAFPFWDHLFSAASKSIHIKCISDDEEEKGTSTNSSNNNTSIKCTSTGIFSNRRPIDGTPAISGTSTPEITAQSHRLGLLATAKRDAAKRGLYSKFFRGPVLCPDTIIEEEKRLTALVSQAFSDSIAETVSVQEAIEIQTADKNVRVDLEVSKSLKKKRETTETGAADEDADAKRDRKRRKKEKKEKKEKKAASHATEKGHKKAKHREKTEDTEANSCTLGKSSPPPPISQKIEDIMEKNMFSGNAIDDHERLDDRKQRKKEEKKRLKRIEKTHAKDAENLKTHPNHGSKTLKTNSSGKQTKPEEISATVPEVLDEPKKRRKKRKHADVE